MKGRVYWRDQRGRNTSPGLGRPWIDFSVVQPDGKSRRVREPAVDADGYPVATKDEAEVYLARRIVEEHERAGSPVVRKRRRRSDPATLAGAVETWIAESRQVSGGGAIQSRASMLRAMAKEVGADLRVDEVTRADLRDFLDERVARRGLALSTQKTYRGTLRSFFGWCVERFDLVGNPAETLPVVRGTTGSREGIGGVEAIRELLAAVEEHRELGPQYALAFLAAVGTKEAATAQVRHFSVERRELRIPRGKKAHRVRTVPLTDYLVRLLQRGVDEFDLSRDDFLIPITPYSLAQFKATEKAKGREYAEDRDIMRACIDRRTRRLHVARQNWNLRHENGREPIKLPPAHLGRHTIAQLLAESGAPIAKAQQLLGHASAATTASFYQRFSPADCRSELDAITDQVTSRRTPRA